MKSLIFTLTFLALGLTTFAQKDTSYWKIESNIALNASATAFKNWSKGGENQATVTGSFFYQANYKKAVHSWDNLILTDLGYSKTANKEYRKSTDRLELNTKYGYQLSPHWNYSVLGNFKTQYVDGFDYPNDTTKIYTSSFLAPAFFKVAIGVDYKPVSYLSLFMSPGTVKWTYVGDQILADAGKFGLEPAVYDTAGVLISHSKQLRTEFGAYVRLGFSKDIFTNVNFTTILDFYSNYLKNPQNIDIDWQYAFTFKINKFLNAQIKGQMIYDDDIMIDVDTNDDGVFDSKGPRTQVYQNLSLGLVYKIR